MMLRRSMLLLTTALLLVGLGLPPTVVAQDQFEAPSWTLGWSTDMDNGYTVTLDDDWDIEGEVVAYVENTRMSQVQLDLTYDVNSWCAQFAAAFAGLFGTWWKSERSRGH